MRHPHPKTLLTLLCCCGLLLPVLSQGTPAPAPGPTLRLWAASGSSLFDVADSTSPVAIRLQGIRQAASGTAPAEAIDPVALARSLPPGTQALLWWGRGFALFEVTELLPEADGGITLRLRHWRDLLPAASPQAPPAAFGRALLLLRLPATRQPTPAPISPRGAATPQRAQGLQPPAGPLQPAPTQASLQPPRDVIPGPPTQPAADF